MKFLFGVTFAIFFLLGGAHKGAKFSLLCPLGIRVVAFWGSDGKKTTKLTWVGCSMLNYDKNVFAYVKLSTKIWGEKKIFVPPIKVVENHCKKMTRGFVQYLK